MLQAIDPKDGLIKRWAGPIIEAASFKEAEYIAEEYFGYLEVVGKIDYRNSLFLWDGWEPFSDN